MDKRKGLTTAVTVLLILSVVWIIAICALLWGRQLSDFSALELTFFIILVVLEVGTMIAEFICAGKISKLNKIKDETPGKKAVRKNTDRRGTLLSIGGILTAFAATMLGIVLGNHLRASVQNVMLVLSIVFAVIPLIMLFVSVSRAKKYAEELNVRSRNIAEFNEFLMSHREDAAATAEEKLRLLTAMLRNDDTCAVLIGVCGFLAALCVGLSCSGISTAVGLTGAVWVAIAFSRIRPKQLHVAVEDCDSLDPGEFPELYALAERAQDNMEAEGEVVLSLTPDINVGITQTGDVCTVYLGVLALAVFTKEELYNVLLHEFSHVVSNDDNYYTVVKYADWTSAGGNPSFVSGLAEGMFRFRALRFAFEYAMYTYASSVLFESEADKAMADFGDAQAAASALLKLKYYALFEWEDWANDQTPYFASEEPDVNVLADRAERFRAAIRERAADWNELTAKEILSNTASHPTAKMRLEALGVEDYALTCAEDAESYRAECDLAMWRLSESVTAFTPEEYEAQRNENYVEPCALIAQWEEEGKPLVAEAYRDIADALIGLCRMKDAEELFDRAIAELDEPAACYAIFNKAELLLRRYDDAGIELIRKAIETNHNYTESGMGLLGAYCCLTGNAEELQRYRETFVEVMQEKLDIYDEFEVLRKEDRLSSEELPDDMLDDILAYLQSVEENEIERLYLVRKTVTEDEGTSVFVVKFAEGIEDERRYELMRSFFNYLDTCSTWQFSLFDYNEVTEVGVEAIEGSLVYENAELVIEALEAAEEAEEDAVEAVGDEGGFEL